MGFTINFVDEISFIPCIGWPEPVDWNTVPDNTDVAVVVCGHFSSTLTGEMKLDNFTGYVRMTYTQQRCAGYPSERKEKQEVVKENGKMVLEAFYKEKLAKSFGELW